jgi:hypothetical protein
MSGILFAVGAITAVVGVAMVGFGIPVKEFSFGNTLIQAGVTAVVGGLIIVALGFVVAQLHRLAEAMAAKSPIRSTRPMDMFDAARAARAPFPSKSKSDMPAHEPFPHDTRADHDDNKTDSAGKSLFAPSLRNPEETHVTLEDDVSLSPQQAPRPAETEESTSQHARDERDMTEGHETALDAGWRPAPRPTARPAATYFDAMWPSESKDAPPASRPAESDYKSFEPKRFEQKPFEPKPLFDPKPYEPKSFEPKFDESKFDESKFEEPKFDEAKFDEPHHEEPVHEPEADLPVAEPVAILKSGVVDGMAYTLYVDGSIEAELPQGTLRFASINELRAHLEKSA